MTTITVRASDSALALEEIAKKLGANAMILATSCNDGLIEITATNDKAAAAQASKSHAAKVDANAPLRTSSHMLPIESPQGQPRVSIDIDQDTPRTQTPSATGSFDSLFDKEIQNAIHRGFPDARDESVVPFADPAHLRQRESATPTSPPPEHQHYDPYLTTASQYERSAHVTAVDPRQIMTGPGGALGAIWPDYPSSFYADLRRDLGNYRQDGKLSGFLEQLNGTLSTVPITDWLSARRLILVGPSDYHKSTVALQMLAAMRDLNPQLRPNLFFCGENAHGDAAYLTTRARLIGACTRIRSPKGFEGLRSIPKTPDIVVVSNDAITHADGLDILGPQLHARVVLVVPQGLHPKMLRAHCEKWLSSNPLVALIRQNESPPLADELSHIAAMGLGLGWTVQSQDILDGLVPFQPDQLCLWAQNWLKSAAQFGAISPVLAHLHTEPTPRRVQEERS